ncbi:MAG: ATP-grasp domain-containing protein, partial [Acidimicrobiales bacterium]
AYPYWLKPVKSAGSFLGFRIESRRQLEHAMEVIRANIGIFSGPFDRVLERADLPPEIAAVGGHHCLVESLIGGYQVTLEGAVQDRRIAFHGMIDSIRVPNQSSFQRYQYPSALPESVQERMRRIASRVLTHIGFDHSCFNVEFFWDDNTDEIWLLEINPRIAQHHSDLFEKVDGVSNHRVAVDVALGRPLQFPHGAGAFGHAACCWLRAFDDGVVTRVPSAEEIEALAREVPGLSVDIHVSAGMRLSELAHQDSYSSILGLFYIGADSPGELAELDQRCRDDLHFEIRY